MPPVASGRQIAVCTPLTDASSCPSAEKESRAFHGGHPEQVRDRSVGVRRIRRPENPEGSVGIHGGASAVLRQGKGTAVADDCRGKADGDRATEHGLDRDQAAVRVAEGHRLVRHDVGRRRQGVGRPGQVRGWPRLRQIRDCPSADGAEVISDQHLAAVRTEPEKLGIRDATARRRRCRPGQAGGEFAELEDGIGGEHGDQIVAHVQRDHRRRSQRPGPFQHPGGSVHRAETAVGSAGQHRPPVRSGGQAADRHPPSARGASHRCRRRSGRGSRGRLRPACACPATTAGRPRRTDG